MDKDQRIAIRVVFGTAFVLVLLVFLGWWLKDSGHPGLIIYIIYSWSIGFTIFVFLFILNIIRNANKRRKK